MSQTTDETTTEDTLHRLKVQGVWPSVRREVLIDQLIAGYALTAPEQETAWTAFKRTIGWDGNGPPPAPYADYRAEELRDLAARQARVQQFKQDRFGTNVESHFIRRKTALDRLTYSLIRVGNGAFARELYFRIHEDGEEFGRVAAAHSQGPEAHTCGVIGPVNRGAIHATLAAILQNAPPGEVQVPRRLGEWFVIVRLEKVLPAVLDAPMQRQMLDELFELFLQSRLTASGATPRA